MTLEHDIALSVLHDVSFDAGGIGDDMNASHLEPSSSLSSVDLPHDPTNITAAAADDSDMHMPITEVLNDLNNIEGKQSSKEITSGPQKPPQSTTTFFSQAWMKNFEKLKQYKEMVRHSLPTVGILMKSDNNHICIIFFCYQCVVSTGIVMFRQVSQRIILFAVSLSVYFIYIIAPRNLLCRRIRYMYRLGS